MKTKKKKKPQKSRNSILTTEKGNEENTLESMIARRPQTVLSGGDALLSKEQKAKLGAIRKSSNNLEIKSKSNNTITIE